MAVQEPIPDSLARKYEKFYHEVLGLTETASDGHALSTLRDWQKTLQALSTLSAESAQKHSEASYNKRHLARIYELLHVSDYDAAIDKLADLKSNYTDAAELLNLKSTSAGAQKGVSFFLTSSRSPFPPKSDPSRRRRRTFFFFSFSLQTLIY